MLGLAPPSSINPQVVLLIVAPGVAAGNITSHTENDSDENTAVEEVWRTLPDASMVNKKSVGVGVAVSPIAMALPRQLRFRQLLILPSADWFQSQLTMYSNQYFLK